MSSKKRSSLIRRRSAARLAASQALYQIELTDETIENVLNGFLTHRIGSHTMCPDPTRVDSDMEVPLLEPDSDLFVTIVRGAWSLRGELDALISECLSGDLELERLEAVLRAILRAGAYELQHGLDTPPLVTISEYTDVARAFYPATEVGLINAVMDKMARTVRLDEVNAVLEEKNASRGRKNE